MTGGAKTVEIGHTTYYAGRFNIMIGAGTVKSVMQKWLCSDCCAFQYFAGVDNFYYTDFASYFLVS